MSLFKNNNTIKIYKLNLKLSSRSIKSKKIKEKKIKRKLKNNTKIDKLELKRNITNDKPSKIKGVLIYFLIRFAFLLILLPTFIYTSKLAYTILPFIKSEYGVKGVINYIAGSQVFYTLLISQFLISQYLMSITNADKFNFFISLPIKVRDIFMAEFLELLLDMLFFIVVLYLPTLCVAGAVLKLSWYFYVLSIFSVVFIAFIIAGIISILIISGFFVLNSLKKKKILQYLVVGIFVIGSIALLILINIGQDNIEKNTQEWEKNYNLNNQLSNILYPIKIILNVVFWNNSSGLSILYSILILLGIGLLLFFAMDKLYYKAMLLQNSAPKKKIKDKTIVTESQKSKNQLQVLFERDSKLIIRDPNLLVSAIISLISPLIMIAIMAINITKTLPVSKTAMGTMSWVEIIKAEANSTLFFGIIFTSGLMGLYQNVIAATSISREAKNLKYLAVWPLNYKKFLLSKFLIGMVYSLLSFIFVSVLTGFIGVPIYFKILTPIIFIIAMMGEVCFSIWFDLMFPSLTWENLNKINSKFKRNIPLIARMFFVFIIIAVFTALQHIKLNVGPNVVTGIIASIFAFIAILKTCIFGILLFGKKGEKKLRGILIRE